MEKKYKIILFSAVLLVLILLLIGGYVARDQINALLSRTTTSSVSSNSQKQDSYQRSSKRQCNQASGECKNSPELQALLDCVLNTNNGGKNPNGLHRAVTGSIFTYRGRHSQNSCHFGCNRNGQRAPGANAIDLGGAPGAPSFDENQVQEIEAAFEACNDPAHPFSLRGEDSRSCPKSWTDASVTHLHGDFNDCACPPPRHSGCANVEQQPTPSPDTPPVNKTDCSKPPAGAKTVYGPSCDLFVYDVDGNFANWNQNTVATEAECQHLNIPPSYKSHWTPVTILGTCLIEKFFEDKLLYGVYQHLTTDQYCQYNSQKYEEMEQYYPTGTDFREFWGEKPVRLQCYNPPFPPGS